MASLRERCKEFIGFQMQQAITRTGSPVDDLMAFVLAEKGRAADASLEATLPMVLYFGSKEDRDEFAALVREAKPGMMTKELP